jgi:pimeloyl-ACP methyl ester carboxylesterase
VSRPGIVLLPGLLCDETIWAGQRAALANAPCVVPSFDALSSLEVMARHVLATAPAGRFLLAGHSMGARVAMEVMRLAPERVERLALLDTGVEPVAPGEAGAAERRRRRELLALARERGMRAMGSEWARAMVHPSRIGTPVFETILEMIGRKTPETFEAHLHALLARRDARAVLAAARCPTLIACGREDAWSPVVRHQQMHALLPAARFAVIENSGHMTTMEQPEVVSRLLAEWAA